MGEEILNPKCQSGEESSNLSKFEVNNCEEPTHVHLISSHSKIHLAASFITAILHYYRGVFPAKNKIL
jgi:hypothetical protein